MTTIEKLIYEVDVLKIEVEKLKTTLQARYDELGFDSARAESAESERDRAKAEAQRAEQELKILQDACRPQLTDTPLIFHDRVQRALLEIE